MEKEDADIADGSEHESDMEESESGDSDDNSSEESRRSRKRRKDKMRNSKVRCRKSLGYANPGARENVSMLTSRETEEQLGTCGWRERGCPPRTRP